ncbi:UPF0001 protein YggS [hydrothermal vent metagenome]|uniref:UPF0001 protein YggS n=1 Tax=hydrothermal vent metagenome TaxID=652676 RepID=A0A3B0SJF0_9ZZZZ
MTDTSYKWHSLSDLQQKIAKAAKISGRKSADISLVAISKTRSADEIRPLLKSGHRIFGENRVQEAQQKWPELRTEYPDVQLHFVGQLQSNKADEAVALFDVIHSVDRPSLVQALSKAMKKQNRQIPCFIQVNIGEELQKGGCDIADLVPLIDISRSAGIEVKGLMCVPPAGASPIPYFALLAKLAKDHDLDGLSMGMSSDFETAVKLGATHLRVGTALFGQRK